MSTDTDTASVEALATKLRSLRVILGRGSPETRGWAPIVQSEIESLVTASIDMTGALSAERDALARRVAELEADGIHSCHPECERPVCVLVRERDALRREVDNLAPVRQQGLHRHGR